MKTGRIFGYVVLAFAYGAACGGSSGRSVPASTTNDAGAAESSTVTSEADGGDLVASHGHEGGATDAAPDRAADVTDDAGSDAATTVSPDGYCCVSGAYYVCPDQATMNRCTGFDIDGCLQSCAPMDSSCATGCAQMSSHVHSDPSGCMHDMTMDSVCTSYDAGAGAGAGGKGPGGVPSPPPTPKNSCGGYFVGFVSCMADWECSGGEHCSQGKCFLDDVSNPCTYEYTCGSGNHCTNGCCASPAKGGACTASFDCNSGKCTNNVCE